MTPRAAVARASSGRGLDRGDGKRRPLLRFVDDALQHRIASHRRAGDEAAARALLATVARAAANAYVQPIAVARAYAMIGDEAATLAWLGRALDERDPWSIYLAVDPTFAPLPRKPAFTRLLARLRLPPPS